MRATTILSATAAVAAAVAVALALPVQAQARSGNVAALQVALQALGLYDGGIDGVIGPRTRRAVRSFQRRRHLAVDGVAGPRTRRALGRRGGPRLGSRPMRAGQRGWDVAALQFMLGARGHSPGTVDGGFGPATSRAVRSFQRSAGLAADGVAGPATLRALRTGGARHRHRAQRPAGPVVGGPVLFFRPVNAPITDVFGMRWGRMHMGIDFPAASGARVGAAGRGVTRFAGWSTGGYGNLVIVEHRLGFETWYAHLERVTSWPGERVVGGTRIGLVGSTGFSTGPHLHFEVRRNGRPTDPMPRLLATAASARASAAGVATAGRVGADTTLRGRSLRAPARAPRERPAAGHGQPTPLAACDRKQLGRQAERQGSRRKSAAPGTGQRAQPAGAGRARRLAGAVC